MNNNIITFDIAKLPFIIMDIKYYFKYLNIYKINLKTSNFVEVNY